LRSNYFGGKSYVYLELSRDLLPLSHFKFVTRALGAACSRHKTLTLTDAVLCVSSYFFHYTTICGYPIKIVLIIQFERTLHI